MPVRHKGLMIILDGLGDRPCPKLNGLTPLEAAATPNMDQLAAQGLSGMMDPLRPGIPVGTHTGTGVLFGLPVHEAATQPRGPIEAAGVNLKVSSGDIFLRCNFATLAPNEDGYRLLHRRAGRISEGTSALAECLNDIDLGDGVHASLKVATGHRAVLRLSGEGLSDQITDTDSYNNFETKGVLACHAVEPNNQAAVKTALAVNRFIDEAYKRLNSHAINEARLNKGLLAANGIITRGAGQYRTLSSLPRHFGLKTAVVAAEKTILGLATLMGYQRVTEQSFTGSASTDIKGKVAAALLALESNDLVFLHFKGTDICSHDFDPVGKKALIETIDVELSPFLDAGLVICVTGDHTTDCNTGNHTADPVPSILASPSGRSDQCAHYGERSCMQGGLGQISGDAMINSMLDAMGALWNYKPSDAAIFSLLSKQANR